MNTNSETMHSDNLFVVAGMRMASWAHIFKYLVPSWKNYLGRLRGMNSLVGGVSQGVDFEVAKTYTIPRKFSLSHNCWSGCELLGTAPVPYLPAATFSPQLSLMYLLKLYPTNKLLEAALVMAIEKCLMFFQFRLVLRYFFTETGS